MSETVLLVATHRTVDAVAAIERAPEQVLEILSFEHGFESQPLPPGCHVVSTPEYIDRARLQDDYLAWLEQWPLQPLQHKRSFEDLFRRPDGYSVWWTGPARFRHPYRGTFSALRMLWLFDRVVLRLRPARVIISTGDAALAFALASRCRRESIPCTTVNGSTTDADPWKGQLPWLLRSCAVLFAVPWVYLLRGAVARLIVGRPAARSAAPSVLFVAELARDVRTENGQASVWFWKSLQETLARHDPQLRHLYRLVYRKTLRPFHAAWRSWRGIPTAIAPDEAFPALGAWLAAVPAQLRSLTRLAGIERTAVYRQSFIFAGADVAPIFAPMVRNAVARSAEWAQTVGSAMAALRTAGNVKAILVLKEFYPSEAATLAAARALGIPTIGVQHGMIFPLHMMYVPPRGYVERAPVPDFFAAYSDYARDTVAGHGAFARSRVWVTGGSRFDELVRRRHDSRAARERLQLPLTTRVVLVTTQSYAWFPEAVRAVMAAARDGERWTVCVKTHPLHGARVDTYRAIAQEVGASNVYFFEQYFMPLLDACDVLISASSTTVFEAILIGRQTICVNFSSDPDDYPYVEDGGSLAARDPEQVREALERAFTPEAQEALAVGRRRFLQRHAGPSATGEASEALAARVLTICRGAQVVEPTDPAPSLASVR